MTNQSETNNPFGTASSGQAPEPVKQSGEFSIRTMKDDLIELAKKPQTLNPTPTIPIAPKKTTSPMPESAPIPSKAADFFPQSTPPEIKPAPLRTESAPIPPKTVEQSPRNNAFFQEKTTSLPKPISTPTPMPAKIPALKENESTSEKLKDATQPFLERNSEKKPLSSNTAFKVLTSVIIILIILIITTGAFYLWKSNTNQVITTIDEDSQVKTSTPDEPPVVIEPVLEKYSSQKTNYLSIDLATATPDIIKNSVVTVANEVANFSSNNLYEFIVVDANNNPVAFPIFATASKLNLSQSTLELLNENFSLFISKDSTGVKLGLAINLKSTEQAIKNSLLKEESQLPINLSFLLLDAKIITNQTTFKDSSYKNTPIRYLNLVEDNSISIDYATKDNQLLIGASKDALRSILDRLSQPQETQPENRIETSSSAILGE